MLCTVFLVLLADEKYEIYLSSKNVPPIILAPTLKFEISFKQSNLHIIVSLAQLSPHPKHHINFVWGSEVGLLPGDV